MSMSSITSKLPLPPAPAAKGRKNKKGIMPFTLKPDQRFANKKMVKRMIYACVECGRFGTVIDYNPSTLQHVAMHSPSSEEKKAVEALCFDEKVSICNRLVYCLCAECEPPDHVHLHDDYDKYYDENMSLFQRCIPELGVGMTEVRKRFRTRGMGFSQVRLAGFRPSFDEPVDKRFSFVTKASFTVPDAPVDEGKPQADAVDESVTLHSE